MTPAARVQATIGILDAVLAGAPAEREAVRWARGARYAGSKDRAAVRDHVFDALRRLRSSAWLGGAGNVPPPAMTGRAVMAGLLRGRGADPAPVFDGSRHGPAPLGAGEPPRLADAPDGVRLDLPDWVLDRLRAAHGGEADALAAALRDRAPVHLRANAARIGRDELIAALTDEGIAACAHPVSPTAVELDGVPRKLMETDAARAGLFELQDAGSQAVVDALPLGDGMRVLDLCAGGGGKTLAMAARAPGARIAAHDADGRRMRDLPSRAARAGADVALTNDPEAGAPYDLVLADVPCSGSGAWRRQPEARWRLTPDRLADLMRMQGAILAHAAALTRRGGYVAYVTCSLLDEENAARVAAAPAALQEKTRLCYGPTTGLGRCDGFFAWIARRVD